jgi:Spy/CpxP family protein refolding chaperone
MQTPTKLLLASAVGLLFAQPLSAQTSMSSSSSMSSMPAGQGMGHMGHMGFGHEGGSAFMMLLKSANLTDAQKQQVHEIMKSEHQQMKAVHQQFAAIHEQLADKLLSPGKVTAAELAPLEQKAYRYQQQIDQSMVDTAISIRSVLTSDQLNHLAQVHKQLQSLHSQIQGIMGTDQDNQGEPADQSN